jgi:hypothetical protein
LSLSVALALAAVDVVAGGAGGSAAAAAEDVSLVLPTLIDGGLR